HPSPSRMQRPDQRFDHRRLEPIPDAGAGGREQADSQIGSEAAGKPDPDLDARTGAAAFDSRQVALVNARGGEGGLADIRLGPELGDLGADPQAELAPAPLQLAHADRDGFGST